MSRRRSNTGGIQPPARGAAQNAGRKTPIVSQERVTLTFPLRARLRQRGIRAGSESSLAVSHGHAHWQRRIAPYNGADR